MSDYRLEHHQLIESALSNFNADFFLSNNIYFGGGTRIALEINEYRKSIDVDFLCPDRASYRAVREEVSSDSLGNLVESEFKYLREIVFNRDGVRTFLSLGDVNLKLEIVAMYDAWEGLPETALVRAKKHYGSGVVTALHRSLKDIANAPEKYFTIARDLSVRSEYANHLFHSVAPQLAADPLLNEKSGK